MLSDTNGAKVARHDADPTGEATDGGKVVGRALAKAKSPDGQGVDWLLVKAQKR